MSFITKLTAFILRQALAKTSTQFVDQIERYFTDPTKALPKAINQANTQTWQLMELAVAGNNLSDRVQRLLISGQMRGVLQPLRERVQGLGTGFCTNCLLELRTARAKNLLTVGTQQELIAAGRNMQVLAEPGLLLAQARQVITQDAEELADYPHLTQLLAISDGGEVLLVTAFGYFLRQEISNHPTLREEMQFSLLTQVVQGQTAGWEELHRLLADQGTELAAELTAISNSLAGLAEGQAGLAQGQAEIMGLIREVMQLLPKSAQVGAISPRVSSMLRSAADKQLLVELERRINNCPADQRTSEMLDAVGRLAMAVGVFNTASERFQQAADSAAHTGVTAKQAEALYNRYRALLEQRQFAAAMPVLLEAARLDPANFTPFPLRRYVPQRILGAGGFGIAFLCHDSYLQNKPLVIKTLNTDGLERSVSSVFSEAHVLDGVQHPAIVKIHDVNYAIVDTEQRPYLVMEYFPGVSLGDYLTQHGCLTLAQVLALARPVAAALEAAHRHKVWHRDLKPDNILVRVVDDGGWDIKIIDFGLAMRAQVVQTSVVSGAANKSIMGESMGGTYLFSAPEQLGLLRDKDGNEIKSGPWSDVYAFGKTLAYALFLSTQPTARNYRQLGDSPLVDLLSDCLEQEVKLRPQDFGAVLQVLNTEEATKRKHEEERLRQEAEAVRKVQEEQQRQEAAEAKRKQQEAEAARKVQEEQQRLAAEAKRKQQEAEAARKAQEEQQRLAAEAKRKQQEADAASKQQEDQQRLTAEAKRKQQEAEAARKAWEEQQCQYAEVSRKQQEAAAARKVREDQQRLAAEAKRKQQESAADIRHGHYLIHPNGTVTDTRNGLMWKRCAEGQTWDGKTCVGQSKDMNWNDIMPNGQQKRWPAFADYDDWRVPTIEELRTIVYCSGGKPKTWNDNNTESLCCKGNYRMPTIDTNAFPNAEMAGFWSSSAIASDCWASAWFVDFISGADNSSVVYAMYRVRLVRVGQ